MMLTTGIRSLPLCCLCCRIFPCYESSAGTRFSNYAGMFVTEAEPEEEEEEIAQLRKVIDRSMKELPQRCQDAVKLRIDEDYPWMILR